MLYSEKAPSVDGAFYFFVVASVARQSQEEQERVSRTFGIVHPRKDIMDYFINICSPPLTNQ